MKIVKAKIKPITRINGNKMLLEIANIARTCYKTPKSNDIEAAKRTVQRLYDCWYQRNSYTACDK